MQSKIQKGLLQDSRSHTPDERPEILPTMKDVELKTLAPTITVDPLDNSKGMPLQDFVNEHKAEKPLIINPYYEDPSIYLAYKPVLLNKEVVVVPTEPKYNMASIDRS
jgi:hypothetical protein